MPQDDATFQDDLGFSDDSALPVAADDEEGDGGASVGSDDKGEEEQVLLTKEGLKKLKEELDFLKTVKLKEVAERLKEAISYGDLSENAEYEEAKNEQAFVVGRVVELERQIRNARIIVEKHAKGGVMVVDIGSTVTVRGGGGHGTSEVYTIVGSMEANSLEKKISNESPLGKGLLGGAVGDVVQVVAPAGTFKYEILKIA